MRWLLTVAMYLSVSAVAMGKWPVLDSEGCILDFTSPGDNHIAQQYLEVPGPSTIAHCDCAGVLVYSSIGSTSVMACSGVTCAHGRL